MAAPYLHFKSEWTALLSNIWQFQYNRIGDIFIQNSPSMSKHSMDIEHFTSRSFTPPFYFIETYEIDPDHKKNAGTSNTSTYVLV